MITTLIIDVFIIINTYICVRIVYYEYMYYIFCYNNNIYGRKIRDKCIGIMIESDERGQKSYRWWRHLTKTCEAT